MKNICTIETEERRLGQLLTVVLNSDRRFFVAEMYVLNHKLHLQLKLPNASGLHNYSHYVALLVRRRDMCQHLKTVIPE